MLSFNLIFAIYVTTRGASKVAIMAGAGLFASAINLIIPKRQVT